MPDTTHIITAPVAGTRYAEALRIYAMGSTLNARQRRRKLAACRAADLFSEPALQAFLAATRTATLRTSTPTSTDWRWTLDLARHRLAAAHIAQHPAPRAALLNQAAYWRQTAVRQKRIEAQLLADIAKLEAA